jgi:hypothetical protein
MSGPWSHVARCLDLHEADIAQAIRSRQSTQELLAHLAAISAPNTGVAKVLLVLARMATTACEWLDGGLRVELKQHGEGTRMDLATDLGGGLRERLLPPIVLHAPLEEFSRAIERVPRLVAPLERQEHAGPLLVLVASSLMRSTSAPPPSVEIASDSLYVRAPAPPVPPQIVEPMQGSQSEPPVDTIDGGWDD